MPSPSASLPPFFAQPALRRWTKPGEWFNITLQVDRAGDFKPTH